MKRYEKLQWSCSEYFFLQLNPVDEVMFGRRSLQVHIFCQVEQNMSTLTIFLFVLESIRILDGSIVHIQSENYQFNHIIFDLTRNRNPFRTSKAHLTLYNNLCLSYKQLQHNVSPSLQQGLWTSIKQ